MTPAIPDMALADIRLDGGTQPRAAIDAKIVEAYAEDMAQGAEFPPIVVFFDGVHYWLADGFHRYFAMKGCGLNEPGQFPADIRHGTQRDAVLYSVGANAAHGLRRTRDDKRRAVMTLLNDPAWSAWSDREIGRQCNVDGKTVAALRPKPPRDAEIRSEPVRLFTSKHGTDAEMRVGNIGKGPVEEPIVVPIHPEPDPEPVDPDAPPTPEQIQRFRQQMAEDGPVATDIWAVVEAFERLPTPTDAARRFPPGLRHTFTDEKATAIARWFAALAAAWQQQNGGHHVAAE